MVDEQTGGDERLTIQIQQFEPGILPVGCKAKLWLEAIPALSGPVLLPAVMARGTRPGRTMLAVAGVHGDEYEGMEAIRAVFAGLDSTRMSGMFVGIIVANPFAYEARARISPLHIDGLNLARVFPGSASGSPTQVLAHELLQLALRLLGPDDLFVDLHSGSADVQFATVIGFRDIDSPARQASEEAARHFGLGDLWAIPDGAGPFNAETARRGIVTVGTETTGRAGFDPDGASAFARGLRGLLSYLGITPDVPAPERYLGPARGTTSVAAPATGFLRAGQQLLSQVREGDCLGDITDLFGEPVAEVRAPASGTIWAARAMPAVRGGDLLYMIARPGAG